MGSVKFFHLKFCSIAGVAAPRNLDASTPQSQLPIFLETAQGVQSTDKAKLDKKCLTNIYHARPPWKPMP
jgi:hypothetical protein